MLISLFFLLACSKDSDLLSDYVLNNIGRDMEIVTLLADDTFIISSPNSVVLDVLLNDVYDTSDEVKIVQTSTPNSGVIVISEDKTIIYSPASNLDQEPASNSDQENDETQTDTFTYTVEIVNEDQSIETEEASVTVVLEEPEEVSEGELSEKLKKLKQDFDEAWAIERPHFLAISNSGDGGDLYYLEGIKGLSEAFQATGDKAYLDEALGLIENIIDNANVSSDLSQNDGYNDNYLSWEDGNNGVTNGVGVNNGGQFSLAERRGFRHVAKLLWVLSQSPTIKSEANYQARYDTILNFVEIHVWEKWKTRMYGVDNFIGNTTGQGALWAHIALYLWKITSKSEYKLVYDSYNDKFRNNLTTTNGGAYLWERSWDGSDSNKADHSHANHDVLFISEAHELDDFWSLSDLYKMKKTVDLFWTIDDEGLQMREYIDGSGSEVYSRIDDGWNTLGRFNETFQAKLEGRDLRHSGPSHTLAINAGIMAYNAAYIEGSIKYPSE